jgi:hypothetical protein
VGTTTEKVKLELLGGYGRLPSPNHRSLRERQRGGRRGGGVIVADGNPRLEWFHIGCNFQIHLNMLRLEN